MLKFKKQPVQQKQAQTQLKPPVPEGQTTPKRQTEDVGAHEDEIRPLAYRKWEEAGRPISDGAQFWLAAETEILRRNRR